jgi:outer membrane protein assembly factor BamB
MTKPDLVLLGIRGSIVAMDRKSGQRAWETSLKGAGFVTVLLDGDQVFAGTHGEIFCLEAATGKILWQDGLKGYGFGLMSIATRKGSSEAAVLAAEFVREQQSSADAGAGSVSS